ncbi:hypothetical protein [Actinocrispum sp. NPDC049592]|uniref:hypothetical protein n=1 Tax=Actinocrispum sp. NPDC049592 TaxID=3154835 RepID=UPI00342256AD
MTAALFTLAGALVGMLGTLATELVRGRRDDRKLWREELRSTCATLASEVSRLRDISHELSRTPDDSQLQRDARQAHSQARALQERLRLISKSVETQEAGRQLIHHVYHQWRATQGGAADFWEARRGLDEWLTKFYVAARAELGLDSSSVYEDPSERLPVPGVIGEKAAADVLPIEPAPGKAP